MGEGKWTPGPWGYRSQEMDDWGYVRGPADAEGRRWPVARASAGRSLSEAEASAHRHADTDPYEANARLIAAAPEMAEALAQAQAALAMMTDPNVIPATSVLHAWAHIVAAESAARAALARARGDQNV